jgi:hypothetical protein
MGPVLLNVSLSVPEPNGPVNNYMRISLCQALDTAEKPSVSGLFPVLLGASISQFPVSLQGIDKIEGRSGTPLKIN